MHNHHDCTRVDRDVLHWDLVGSFETPIVCELVDSVIQQQVSQQPCISESSCRASRVSHEHSGRFSDDVNEGGSFFWEVL